MSLPPNPNAQPKAEALYTVTITFKDKTDEVFENVTFPEANNIIQNSIRSGVPVLAVGDNPQRGLKFYPAHRVHQIEVAEQLIQKVAL